MPGLDMMPRQNPDDHEAAMARADLYKLANYSMKLFKMIQDGDQLEGWVQAKITKAADYVASVYHFMEYEMKFSEYGEKLETSDMYTEEVRKQFKAKLTEAKIKLDKLKKKNEKDLEEAKFEKSGVRAGDKKKGKVDKSERKQYFVKLEKGDRTRGVTMVADEGESESELRDRAKRENMGWTIVNIRAKDTVDEAAKPDFLDMDKDGNKKEPMKKAVADKKKGSVKNSSKVSEAWPGTKEYKEKHGSDKERHQAKYGKDDELEKEYEDKKKKGGYGKLGPSGSDTEDEPAKTKPGRGRKKSNEGVAEGKCNHSPKGKSCPVHGLKECGSMYEGSTGDYSAKKARAGKDIGKPGKNFAKIAAKAEKSGAKSGEAVAGAVLKNLRAKG